MNRRKPSLTVALRREARSGVCKISALISMLMTCLDGLIRHSNLNRFKIIPRHADLSMFGTRKKWCQESVVSGLMNRYNV